MRHKRKTDHLRYAPYLRCSDDDQAHGDFTTIHSQDNLTSRYVAAKPGATLLEAYVDEGRSGTNLNRPGWKRLLADAQAGLVDAVVVTYMSRLGRGDAFTVAEYLLKECGVRIELVQESFGNDIGGYVAKKATNLMDGMYPVMVSQWVRTKQAAMVAMGYWPGGNAPFGYTTVPAPGASHASVRDYKDDKQPPRILIPSDDAPLVVSAWDLFLSREMLTEVREYLQSVASSANQWNYEAVRRFLQKPVYKGTLIYGSHSKENAHPALIEIGKWEAAQDALRRLDSGRSNLYGHLRAQGYRKESRSDEAIYYLRGLVRCDACGCMMTPSNHHGKTSVVRYYECTGVLHGNGISACPVKRVNAQTLHDEVLGAVRQVGSEPGRLHSLIAAAVAAQPKTGHLSAQVSALKARETDAARRLSRLGEAIEKAGALESLLSRIAAVEQEATLLRSERVNAERKLWECSGEKADPGEIALYWRRFSLLWNEATEEERSVLMPLLVEGVTMTGRNERGRNVGRARLRLDVTLPKGMAGVDSGISNLIGSRTRIRTSVFRART